jgi:integrase
MASASITPRQVKGGKRYVVRYRLGGRAFPIQHGGSFQTMKEARARRDLIAGELAAGRNPADLLQAMVEQPKVRTFRQVAEEYRASRLGHAAATRKNTEAHLLRLNAMFGDRDPLTITPTDEQEWVVANSDLRSTSMAKYLTTLRLVLRFARGEMKVQLPASVTEEINPPTARQLLAILDAVPARWVLPFVTIEQTAMRIGETVLLAWGDVDVAGSQFRLARRSTKSRRPRWVQVPEWLMDEIERTCPLEDRTPERRVFHAGTDAARRAMEQACKIAGISHFTPHDLRHRRISLWHGQGVPAKQLAERAGHARASMSLDVYSHVMPLEEVASDDFLALIRR